jgi:hypothetical protein
MDVSTSLGDVATVLQPGWSAKSGSTRSFARDGSGVRAGQKGCVGDFAGTPPCPPSEPANVALPKLNTPPSNNQIPDLCRRPLHRRAKAGICQWPEYVRAMRHCVGSSFGEDHILARSDNAGRPRESVECRPRPFGTGCVNLSCPRARRAPVTRAERLIATCTRSPGRPEVEQSQRTARRPPDHPRLSRGDVDDTRELEHLGQSARKAIHPRRRIPTTSHVHHPGCDTRVVVVESTTRQWTFGSQLHPVARVWPVAAEDPHESRLLHHDLSGTRHPQRRRRQRTILGH